MKDAWFQEHLAGAKSALPFSFIYAGQPSASLLAEWPKKVESVKVDANELMVNGLTVEIKDKPGAAVIVYRRII